MSNVAADSKFAARPSTDPPSRMIFLAAAPIRKPSCERTQRGKQIHFRFPSADRRSVVLMPWQNTAHKEFTTRMATQRGQREATYPGVISLTEIYALDEARRRLRWTESAMRAARRRGLNLLTCGKRRYVTGQEILRFLEQINAGS